MIKSWSGKKVRKLFEGGDASAFSGLSPPAALRRLAALDAATSMDDLAALDAFRPTELKRKGKGMWRLPVDGLWAIEFRVRRDNVFDVALEETGKKK